MGGLYDILESYRLQDPKFTYEGLYQDPPRDDTTYYGGDLKDYPYGLISDAGSYQAFKSSAFPQDYPYNSGVVSLFNPRVGRPEQSIYYNEPEPADPTSDFYQPLPGFINAPQNYYPAIKAMQEEEDEEDQLPYSGVGDMRYQTPRTIADQNRILGQTFTKQKPSGIARLFEVLGNIPTPMNILRGGLESLRGLNKKIRGTTLALSPTLKDYVQAKKAEKRAAAGADVGVGPGGSGSRRGDADISGPRGGFATDDTAGFF